jgi:hypothetical protein
MLDVIKQSLCENYLKPLDTFVLITLQCKK